MRILYVFVGLLFISIQGMSNIDSTLTIEVMPDSLFAQDSLLPDESNFEANLDSMMNLYYVKQSIELSEDSLDSDSLISARDIPDSIYIQRLAALPFAVEMTFNQPVRRYIEMYTQKKSEQVEKMLGLAEYYFPIFDEIFDYHGVPNEMKYMSIIESGLNPRAYSRARAVGLWQFMYGTGRMSGLEINSIVDERCDPIKATHAAALYSKKMYDIYKDWILVIAAYNCGPGNVNKAIRRAGGKRGYWDIYPYLPRETRGHVPAFIAAAYTMNYYHEHGLKASSVNMPATSDTLMVYEKVHLEQIAKVLDIPIDLLRDLNPQFRYDIVPATSNKPYHIRLPEQEALAFIDLQDSIFAYNDSIYFSPKIEKKPNYTYHIPQAPGKDYVKLTYMIKSGDNLGFISMWYDVRLSDLKMWNGINGNTIRAGQKLVIYKHKSTADKYADIDHLSFSQKQARIGKATATSISTGSKPSEELKEGSYIVYTVQTGDTLWDIAQKFPGISDTDIMRWNSIDNASKLKPGQKLRIKKTS